MKNRATSLLILHILLIFYSLSGIFSKSASGYVYLSAGFIICYAVVLIILFAYAIGWQQILKRLPLTVAFANKAITVVWGLFWGVIIFGETVKPGMVVGALITICGVVMFSLDDKKEARNDD